MYDAVYLASHTGPSEEHGRHAIVLTTDRQDNGSKLSMKEAMDSAQKPDAIIYGILYLDNQSYSARSRKCTLCSRS